MTIFNYVMYNTLRRERNISWTPDRMLWAASLCAGPDRDDSSTGSGLALHAMEYVVTSGRIPTPHLLALLALKGAKMRNLLTTIAEECDRAKDHSIVHAKTTLYETLTGDNR